MKAKLVVEGKEFDIEINNPKLQELLTPQKKTGYERVGDGYTYSFVNSWDKVDTFEDKGSDDDLRYESANYYSDRTIAENNARADRLMRQLRRFAVEHRKNAINWTNADDVKYEITYDYEDQSLEVLINYACKEFGTIYFDTIEAANQAIEAFRDELVWYFTEYKDSL